MYNGHFKFRESPFGITPDPQFYYSNPAYPDLCASICRGIAGDRGIIVITGEPGTGKTTLLQKILRSLGPEIQTAYLPQTLLEDNTLLPLVLDDLGVTKFPAPSDGAKEQLRHYLIEQNRNGKRVALLIDEAQNLSIDCMNEIEELSGWESGNTSLLRIVLAGQPELAAKLKDPPRSAVKQRMALRCTLHPLRSDEVPAYVDARLRATNRRADDLFESKALDLIARISGGIPRIINLLCDHGLLAAYAESASKVGAAMVREAAADLQLAAAPDDPLPDQSSAPKKVGPHGPEEFPEDERTVFAVAVDHPQRHSRFFCSGRRIAQMLAAGFVALLMGSALYWKDDPPPRARPAAHAVARSPAVSATHGMAADVSVDPSERMSAAAEHAGVSPIAAAVITQSSLTRDPLRELPPEAKAASDRIVPSRIEPPRRQTAKAPREDAEPAPRPVSYTVVGPSFVRARPTADAEIIATLEPGAELSVIGRRGDYFRIRASGRRTLAGFIHREDAFFEKKR